MQSKRDFADYRRSICFYYWRVEPTKVKWPSIQRISERRYVSLVGLMQYLNIGRKYDAAAVTFDLPHLPNNISFIQQAKIVMTRLFFEEDESLSNSSHSEEESPEILDERSLTLYVKLEKAIHSKTKVLLCLTSKSFNLNKIGKQELQLFD
ncbi:hypothetical protein AVEN_219452-1 [Araneus ventricosus]|uniref:Uncharacterized protein n=1 Tax=Araneus ventricosus TaxID=182803 RepID=A0A4Y2BM56_ARAVE|nr:hypothetical protein AVEN_219452-1 [Araneus ventricosus]